MERSLSRQGSTLAGIGSSGGGMGGGRQGAAAAAAAAAASMLVVKNTDVEKGIVIELFQLSFHKVRRNRTNVMAMQNFMSGGSGSNNPGNNGSFNIDTGNRAGSGFRRTNSSSSFGHRAGEGGSGNG
ncbi:unnamed protein product, partial [Sphacelaria rigidula]